MLVSEYTRARRAAARPSAHVECSNGHNSLGKHAARCPKEGGSRFSAFSPAFIDDRALARLPCTSRSPDHIHCRYNTSVKRIIKAYIHGGRARVTGPGATAHARCNSTPQTKARNPNEECPAALRIQDRTSTQGHNAKREGKRPSTSSTPHSDSHSSSYNQPHRLRVRRLSSSRAPHMLNLQRGGEAKNARSR